MSFLHILSAVELSETIDADHAPLVKAPPRLLFDVVVGLHILSAFLLAFGDIAAHHCHRLEHKSSDRFPYLSVLFRVGELNDSLVKLLVEFFELFHFPFRLSLCLIYYQNRAKLFTHSPNTR